MTSDIHTADSSDVRWRIAAENAGVAVWDYSLDQAHWFFSNEWFYMRGLDPKRRPSYEVWLANVHPEDAERAFQNASAMHNGSAENVNYEYRERHKDGQYIWILTSGRPVEWDASGAPIRFVGTDTDVSHVKMAEREREVFAEDQMRLQVAIESAGQGVWDSDLETGDARVSPTWRKMRGYSLAGSYGHDRDEWLADIHPDDRALVINENGIRGDTGDYINHQYRHRHKDGKYRWILSRGKIVRRNPRGDPARLIGIDTDITDIKETEGKLESLSRKLELAISAAQVGVWERRFADGVAIWDARTCEIFGLPEDQPEVPPETFRACVHPDDLGYVIDTSAAAANRGEDFMIDFRIIHPDLGVRFLRSRAKFHTDPQSGGRHVGITWDVTELRENEMELANAYNLLDQVLDQMEQGLVVFKGDPIEDATIALSNRKYAEFLQMPETLVSEETTFRDYLEYVERHWDFDGDRKHSFDEFLGLVNDGKSLGTIFKAQSGRVVRSTGNAMGKNARIVTFTDVTDLVQAEEQRAELARDLSHVQRLQAVGQLTGGVAHDFNNLLAVVLGNAELLAEELGEKNESLEYIIQASRRGAELTQRLLAFSRKQSLQPTALNIGQMIADMEGLLRPTLGETILVKAISAPDLWMCLGDGGQVQNALLNLAVNGRDAMPKGGTLTIRSENAVLDEDFAQAHQEVEPGEYVKITVSDTGYGMPQHIIDRAFEPFFTTKEVGEGSGLGLSMVFGLIKQSGGHISIKSEQNQGTEIAFYLPRAQDYAVPDETVVATPKPNRGSGTILLVEDDAAVRKMVRRALGGMGYEVMACEMASDALSILEQSSDQIDVLLTDVILPGRYNGADLGKKVAALYPDIRTIYMSGHTSDILQTHQTGGEAVDLLQKPFDIEKLGARIAKLMAD